jgi:ribosomal subunit interface protein
MSLQVTGKNIQISDSFKSYVAEKLDVAIGKYVGEHLTAHVRIEKERGRFHTSCSVRLRTGLLMESSGEGADAYASADASFERLEKRLRRYKRRLTSHHHHNHAASSAPQDSGVQVGDYVVELSEPEDDETVVAAVSDNPLVVAETERTLRAMSVSDAVMQLDLTEAPFLVFRNASNEAINVVYRRDDGNIGWIDPTSPAGSGRVGSSSSAGKSRTASTISR